MERKMSQNTAPFFVDGSVCFGLVVDSMACLRGVTTHYRYLRMKDSNPGTDDYAVPRTLTCTLDWSLMFVELSSIFKLQGSQEQKRLRRVPRREGGLGNGSGTERPAGTRTDISVSACQRFVHRQIPKLPQSRYRHYAKSSLCRSYSTSLYCLRRPVCDLGLFNLDSILGQKTDFGNVGLRRDKNTMNSECLDLLLIKAPAEILVT